MMSSMSVAPDFEVSGNGCNELRLQPMSPDQRAARAFPTSPVERRHLEGKSKKDLVAMVIRYQQLMRLAQHDASITRDSLQKELQYTYNKLRLQERESRRWEERLDRVLRLQPIGE